jgi:tight adherence protein C
MSALTLWSLFGCVTLVIGSCLVLIYEYNKDKRVEERLKMVRRTTEQYHKTGINNDSDPEDISKIAFMLSRLGASVASSGILPGKTLAELSTTLSAAGFASRHALTMFVGTKIALMILLPPTTFLLMDFLQFSSTGLMLGTGGAAVAGLLLPDMVVRHLRDRHLKAVELGLADALDMLVICAEAGLALEPAITRVGREIAPAHPSVSREFLQTANEMRIASDYRGALTQMGNRTGLEGIKRLTTTMVQTLQYGTPLTQALRVLSAELRTEMITRFEARAARLPVLLTLPMILFILPCVFLVVGGPAVIQVAHIFHKG